jgi:hypothetical protein
MNSNIKFLKEPPSLIAKYASKASLLGNFQPHWQEVLVGSLTTLFTMPPLAENGKCL